MCDLSSCTCLLHMHCKDMDFLNILVGSWNVAITFLSFLFLCSVKAAKRNRRVGLYKTGTVATATFSTSSLGLSPKLQAELDKITLASCQISGMGPCSTTIVWTTLGYMPSIEALLSFMRNYVAVWRSSSSEENIDLARNRRLFHPGRVVAYLRPRPLVGLKGLGGTTGGKLWSLLVEIAVFALGSGVCAGVHGGLGEVLFIVLLTKAKDIAPYIYIYYIYSYIYIYGGEISITFLSGF